jgi:FeS assembly SUF system regulator
MIKIGKLTDYAVVLMGKLSKEGDGVSRSAHYLSEKTGVPEPTVAKIMKMLAQENLVASVRGAAGGYKLSKAPDQISIAEIIAAMEGPIAIVSCVSGDEGDCMIAASCPMKGNWDKVNQSIKSALDEVKLTEMMDSSCCKSYDFTNSPQPSGAETK